jgi:hypothetical protein
VRVCRWDKGLLLLPLLLPVLLLCVLLPQRQRWRRSGSHSRSRGALGSGTLLAQLELAHSPDLLFGILLGKCVAQHANLLLEAFRRQRELLCGDVRATLGGGAASVSFQQGGAKRSHFYANAERRATSS